MRWMAAAFVLAATGCQSSGVDSTTLALITACTTVAAGDETFAFVMPPLRPMTVELNGIRLAVLQLRVDGEADTTEFTCAFAPGERISVVGARISAPCDNCNAVYDEEAVSRANRLIAEAATGANP